MTHIAAHIHLRRSAGSRYGAALSVLALGLGFVLGASAPAAAQSRTFQIAGIPYTDPHPGRDTYQCVKGRYGISSTRYTDRAILSADGHGDITDADAQRECAQRCSRDERCHGFNVILAGTPGYRDVGHKAYYCDMLRTVDSTWPLIGDPTGEASAVCYRRLRVRHARGIDFPSELQADTRFQQDQFRPSYPPGQSPASQYKGK